MKCTPFFLFKIQKQEINLLSDFFFVSDEQQEKGQERPVLINLNLVRVSVTDIQVSKTESRRISPIKALNLLSC